MIMPNFIIIGAAKSGTTALFHYLKQHPQIYMSPVKEPTFFAFEEEWRQWCGPDDQKRAVNYFVKNMEDYRALFQDVTEERAIGEASPWYIYSSKAPNRIKEKIPDVKLIAILRHPADRAYSHFSHLVRGDREPVKDFAQVIREEETRISKNWGWNWHYVRRGFYYQQLKNYFDVFERQQLKVYLYDDLKRDSQEVLKGIFQYLNVDTEYQADISAQHNVSYIPKSQLLRKFLMKNNPLKSALKTILPKDLGSAMKAKFAQWNFTKPELDPEIRQELVQLYREDILQLQELIQRDLSDWLR